MCMWLWCWWWLCQFNAIMCQKSSQ